MVGPSYNSQSGAICRNQWRIYTVIRFRRFIAVATIAAFLSTVGASITWSQVPTPTPKHRGLHSKITPQEKQQSNADISQAIQQLTAAQGALSNPAAASGDVTEALSSLSQALPIYHGYRVKAMGQCKRAIRQLSRPKRAAMAQGSIATALSDANAALQNAGDEVNEAQ